jgi:hypothetical protein
MALVMAALITLVVSSWLIANWDDFKAGLTGEPAPVRSSRP